MFPEDGPVITGGKSRYEVGDRVRVNCTSHRSKPAAELTWFINNEEVSSLSAVWVVDTHKLGSVCSVYRMSSSTTISGVEVEVEVRRRKTVFHDWC